MPEDLDGVVPVTHGQESAGGLLLLDYLYVQVNLGASSLFSLKLLKSSDWVKI